MKIKASRCKAFFPLVFIVLSSGISFGQINERWIIYGNYEEDNGDTIIARYKFEHKFNPWKISLAQYGLEEISFREIQISGDTSKIKFNWNGREFCNCELNRVKVGEKIWESIWKGRCSNSKSQHKIINIGLNKSPDFGKSLKAGKVDVAIIDHAIKTLSPQNWSKEDDRICNDDLENLRYSLFCTLFNSSVEVGGEYLHRRPAMKVIRDLVYEKYEDRIDSHTLKDFNNHSKTTFEEVVTILSEAKKLIIDELKE